MKIIFPIILLFLVSACSQKPSTVKKYYRLNLPESIESAEKHKAVLWIKRPEAHSILGNRPMVATDSEGALQQLNYHAWIESPKVLLQELLQENAKLTWKSVHTERPHTDKNYFQLHSRILAFEKKQNHALVNIAFKFYGPDMLLLNQQTLKSKISISENNYPAFSTAVSEAIIEILEKLELTP